MRAHAAILVPTLATYAALFSEGQRLGWSAAMLEKLERVRAAGLNGIRLARSEGVPVAFGTDLLGEMHALQSSEFTLRAEVLTATEILQSATSVAAQLLRQEGVLGVIASGAVADLLIMDGDPSQDCGVLADPQKNLRLVMQGGRIAHNFLS
jgi:imidazolonepropionase-like amidohydrolase